MGLIPDIAAELAQARADAAAKAKAEQEYAESAARAAATRPPPRPLTEVERAQVDLANKSVKELRTPVMHNGVWMPLEAVLRQVAAQSQAKAPPPQEKAPVAVSATPVVKRMPWELPKADPSLPTPEQSARARGAEAKAAATKKAIAPAPERTLLERIEAWIKDLVARLGREPMELKENVDYIGKVIDRMPDGAFAQAVGSDGRYVIHKSRNPPAVGARVHMRFKVGCSVVQGGPQQENERDRPSRPGGR